MSIVCNLYTWTDFRDLDFPFSVTDLATRPHGQGTLGSWLLTGPQESWVFARYFHHSLPWSGQLGCLQLPPPKCHCSDHPMHHLTRLHLSFVGKSSRRGAVGRHTCAVLHLTKPDSSVYQIHSVQTTAYAEICLSLITDEFEHLYASLLVFWVFFFWKLPLLYPLPFF